MNDTEMDRWEFEANSVDQSQLAKGEPQFGLIDLVEAFTAMRHEWRSQSRESRDLSEKLASVVERLDALAPTDSTGGGDELPHARQLAQVLAETDHQLTRAIESIVRSRAAAVERRDRDVAALRAFWEGMHPIARWFSHPLKRFVQTQLSNDPETLGQDTIDGLELLLEKLRRSMQHCQLERLDVEGESFDAQLMSAIGTVEAADFEAGQVAEQVAPGYRWRGQMLRYAAVRVAK